MRKIPNMECGGGDTQNIRWLLKITVKRFLSVPESTMPKDTYFLKTL